MPATSVTPDLSYKSATRIQGTGQKSTTAPSGHVFDLPVIDVEEEGVQGEVAPKGVFLRRSERSFRDAAVRAVKRQRPTIVLLFYCFYYFSVILLFL